MNFLLRFVYAVLYVTVFPMIVLCFTPAIFLTELNSTFQNYYYSYVFKFCQTFVVGIPLRRFRTKLFAMLGEFVTSAKGPVSILEVGPGYGENFPLYPPSTQLSLIELNPVLKNMTDKLEFMHPNINIVESVIGNVQNMTDINDNSYDVIVGTEVMCCFDDNVAALKEIRRVLKPKGKYFFMEISKYSKEDGSILRTIQAIMVKFTGSFTLGCKSGKIETEKLLRKAGFVDIHIETELAEWMPVSHQAISFGWASRT